MLNKLLEKITTAFEKLPDHRKQSNATKYSIKDAALSAFIAFYLQFPSFRSYQKDAQRPNGLSQKNFQSIFGEHQTPSENQMRNLLDPIKPENVGNIFWTVYDYASKEKILEPFKSVNGTMLIGMDGTQYHSSTSIHCQHCNTKQYGDTTHYSHNVIAPVLLSPEHEFVLPLEPEFIWPQDGSEKQDCEQNAIKRWILRNSNRFNPFSATIMGDDLHGHYPTCKLCLDHKLNFIFVCKPESHHALYQEIELLSRIDAVSNFEKRVWNGRFHEIHRYRFAEALPIRADAEPLRVNWCELTTIHEKTGEVLHRFSFITNFSLSQQSVPDIVAAGRARWKNENESHNSLKNHGYHLEHNFGHGELYLSMILLSLNLLSFLVHTLLSLSDALFHQLRLELGARVTLFESLRSLFRFFIVHSWEYLLFFMAFRLGLEPSAQPP